MVYQPHPWHRGEGKEDEIIDTWCLCKVVEPELVSGAFDVSFETVAVFPYDSAGKLFQNHLFHGGTVDVGQDMIDLFESMQRLNNRNKG